MCIIYMYMYSMNFQNCRRIVEEHWFFNIDFSDIIFLIIN